MVFILCIYLDVILLLFTSLNPKLVITFGIIFNNEIIQTNIIIITIYTNNQSMSHNNALQQIK